MIAGRLRWRTVGAKLPPRDRCSRPFTFRHGALVLTEAGTTRRASMHLVRGEAGLAEFDRGGLEVLDATLAAFAARLRSENHTLKRALDRSAPVQRHRQRVFGRDSAPRAAVAGDAHVAARATTTSRGSSRPRGRRSRTWTERLRARGGQEFPGEGDGVPRGNGGARPIRQAVSRVRNAGAAHPLRRQRDELLRALPDGRQLLADRALSRLLERTGRGRSTTSSDEVGGG